ncbi:MAG: translocation/assembly module TamB domain-containing protein [Vicinamibacterales bacterium]
MNNPAYAATLSGHAQGHITVTDALVGTPDVNDYVLDASLTLRDSIIRDIEISRADVVARMREGTMQVDGLVANGPGVDLTASGRLELDGERSSEIAYDITRADLARLRAALGRDMRGQVVTTGRLTGPTTRLQFVGNGRVTDLATSGVQVQQTTADYDVTVPTAAPRDFVGQIKASVIEAVAGGQVIRHVEARATYDAGRVTTTADLDVKDGLAASLYAAVALDLNGRTAFVDTLSLTLQRTTWQLAAGTRPGATWTDTGMRIEGLQLVDDSGSQHLSAAGTWDSNGPVQMRVTAQDVQLASVILNPESAGRYGGVLQATATIGGTGERPTVAADFMVTSGRVRRLGYQSFGGHVDYRDETFQIDARLDQAPDVWLTMAGAVPLSVVDRTRPARPIRLAVKSSDVSLTLLEGVSDVVRNVTGQMRLDVTVLGTSSDPHFSGRVDLNDAAFDVVATGARYRKGRLALQLATDRVGIEAMRVEDEQGHPLELTGSLGTHEMRVGNLQVTVNARNFQVLRNEYGQLDIDANLNLAGEFESPRLTGRLTVTGGELNVDRVLDQALFQPYSTVAASAPVDIDPIVALNPWERMGMDLELHVPGTLRMVGENVQVSPGTPLGLGDIKLRAFGDLYLYKDPAQPMYINGSLDSLTGTYVFQGRRFNLESVELDRVPRRLQSGAVRDSQPRDLGGRHASLDHRTDAAAGTAALKHAAARTVGHPVADRLQHVDQRSLGASTTAAGGSRRHAGGRLPCRADGVGSRAHARDRHAGDRAWRGHPRRHARDRRQRDRTRPRGPLQPAVRRGRIRRSNDRVLPVPHPSHSRNVLGRRGHGRTVAIPPRGTRRHRPAALLQLLIRSLATRAVTFHSASYRRQCECHLA